MKGVKTVGLIDVAGLHELHTGTVEEVLLAYRCCGLNSGTYHGKCVKYFTNLLFAHLLLVTVILLKQLIDHPRSGMV